MQGIDSGPLAGAVVAIGNFDGVHRGHRAVIGAALKRARALGRKAAALTFAPHPRLFLRPQDIAVPALQRARQAAPAGGDRARRRHHHDLRRGAGRDLGGGFHRQDPRGALGIGGAAIGFDFHFGQEPRRLAGFLAEQGARLGFAVDVVPPLEDEGRPVSSGAVRAALAAGRVVEATELLGAPWFVSGEVIHGDKRGRELGFPTANLKLDPSCGLKHGIYAVRVDIARQAP